MYSNYNKYLLINVLLICFLVYATHYSTRKYMLQQANNDIKTVNECNERLTRRNIILQKELDLAYEELDNRQVLIDWTGKYIARKGKK